MTGNISRHSGLNWGAVATYLSLFMFLGSAVGGLPAQAAQADCRSWFKLDPALKVEPQNTSAALFDPDCYAWQLFFALNWPVKPESCEPDLSRKPGDDGAVVWESWISKHAVFLKDAAPPPSWDDNCNGPEKTKELFPSAQLNAVIDSLATVPGFEPPGDEVSNAADEEVRLNRSALDFIRDEGLYNLTNQRKKAATGQRKIEFPPASKEVKAHWIKLSDPADFSRYHTGMDKDGNVYGLVALHITTKDLPNWFWATFEHIDNKERWPQQSPDLAAAFAGWVVKPQDRFACSELSPNCEQLPAGIGLEGTKWENYRLKATQVDWVDSFGEPTKVVNSKIEGGFNQNQSSCISCHALARIGDKSAPMPYLIVDLEGPVDGSRMATFIGVVDMDDLRPRSGAGTEASSHFLQLDFVWSLRNACPEPGDPNRLSMGPNC